MQAQAAADCQAANRQGMKHTGVLHGTMNLLSSFRTFGRLPSIQSSTTSNATTEHVQTRQTQCLSNSSAVTMTGRQSLTPRINSSAILARIAGRCALAAWRPGHQ
eukprot:GHUV01009815.1.p2 GENE.GHUV01009815.1~~GHUV01009815.1.p2  ORF type:complete len:105 (-),score=20.06 GHUV01009815.1:1032-1346(-)